MSEHIFDQKWNAASLLRFAFPTIVMMVFMGLYTIVDTIFVARFVSTDALSAINIVCPVINLTVGLGTMIAAGGSAVVSRKMGAGLEQEAKEDFTLLVLAAAGVGAAILICGTLWLNPILLALGASERLLPYCRDYLGLLLLFLPANVIQTVYANLFVTAGKPGLGFGLSVLAGLANILLDYVFIVPGGMEIRGAALGTGLGYLIPAAAGTVSFFRNRGALSFVKLRWRGALLTESCLNGSSEMVGQLAAALTTFFVQPHHDGAAGRGRGGSGHDHDLLAVFAEHPVHRLFHGRLAGDRIPLRERQPRAAAENPFHLRPLPHSSFSADLCTFHLRRFPGRTYVHPRYLPGL